MYDEWAPSYFEEYVDSSNVCHEVFGDYNYYCGLDGAMKTGWFRAYAEQGTFNSEDNYGTTIYCGDTIFME